MELLSVCSWSVSGWWKGRPVSPSGELGWREAAASSQASHKMPVPTQPLVPVAW